LSSLCGDNDTREAYPPSQVVPFDDPGLLSVGRLTSCQYITNHIKDTGRPIPYQLNLVLPRFPNPIFMTCNKPRSFIPLSYRLSLTLYAGALKTALFLVLVLIRHLPTSTPLLTLIIGSTLHLERQRAGSDNQDAYRDSCWRSNAQDRRRFGGQ
jgi:hypothetical protein